MNTAFWSEPVTWGGLLSVYVGVIAVNVVWSFIKGWRGK